MADLAIRVENLGKQYRIGEAQERYRTLREALAQTARSPFRRLSAGNRRSPDGSVSSRI